MLSAKTDPESITKEPIRRRVIRPHRNGRLTIFRPVKSIRCNFIPCQKMRCVRANNFSSSFCREFYPKTMTPESPLPGFDSQANFQSCSMSRAYRGGMGSSGSKSLVFRPWYKYLHSAAPILAAFWVGFACRQCQSTGKVCELATAPTMGRLPVCLRKLRTCHQVPFRSRTERRSLGIQY